MVLDMNAIPADLFGLPAHDVTAGAIHHDRWCSPYLCVRFPGLHGRVRIELEYWNPTMIDVPANAVALRVNHRAIDVRLDLQPEDIVTVRQEVDVEGELLLSLRSAGRCPPSTDDLRTIALVIRHLAVEPVSMDG
jgi:hypothetical protein